MGISAWYDTWCDEDDCLQWTQGGRTRGDAAKAARQAGWRNEGKGRGWRCPGHQRRLGRATD